MECNEDTHTMKGPPGDIVPSDPWSFLPGQFKRAGANVHNFYLPNCLNQLRVS